MLPHLKGAASLILTRQILVIHSTPLLKTDNNSSQNQQTESESFLGQPSSESRPSSGDLSTIIQVSEAQRWRLIRGQRFRFGWIATLVSSPYRQNKQGICTNTQPGHDVSLPPFLSIPFTSLPYLLFPYPQTPHKFSSSRDTISALVLSPFYLTNNQKSGRIRHPPLSPPPLPAIPWPLNSPRQRLPPPHHNQRPLPPNRFLLHPHPRLRRGLARPLASRHCGSYYPWKIWLGWNGFIAKAGGEGEG